MSESGSPMPSVDKALRTLTYLAVRGGGNATLAQIAQALSLNKSSLHLTLAALRHRDFVTQDPVSGRYRLGPQVQTLSRGYLTSLGMPSGLPMAIRRLADEINEVVHVGVLEGTSVLFIDKAESTKPIQAAVTIGMRFPAISTAIGQAVLSQQFSSLEEFRLRFGDLPAPGAGHSPASVDEAWVRVATARRLGYGSDLGANFEGLRAVALAILDGDIPIVGVSVVCLASETGGAAPLHHLAALRTCLESILSPTQRVQGPM